MPTFPSTTIAYVKGYRYPDFSGGPEKLIAYKTVLADTVVHGPYQENKEASRDPKESLQDPDKRALVLPRKIPDDLSTVRGRLVHYNRLRLLSASIAEHYDDDGSFTIYSRGRVKDDLKYIIKWPATMILFCVRFEAHTKGPLYYYYEVFAFQHRLRLYKAMHSDTWFRKDENADHPPKSETITTTDHLDYSVP